VVFITLLATIAAPFRHTRKERLKKNELIYYLALDRKWMSIEQANLLLIRAKDDGLIGYDGDMIRPLFDITAVEIPVGFKPSSGIFERADPVQQLIDRIAGLTGNPVPHVVTEMNRTIHEEFDGHLLPEAAVVMVAKRHRVPFEDTLSALQEQLRKE
jgi:hypothetical protein